jgi:hypothetical protein
MELLIFCLTVFGMAFLAHLVIWFFHVPSKPYPALLMLFALAWVFVAALRLALPAAWAEFYPDGFWPWAAAALFHAACSLSYIILYSALEQDSPSLTMIKYTDMAAREGRAPGDYKTILSDDLVIGSRLNALVEGQLVHKREHRYYLAPKGAFWDRVFGLWMKLLGIRTGG